MSLGGVAYSLLVVVRLSEALAYSVLILLLSYRLNRSMDCVEYCECIEIAKFDNLAFAVVLAVHKSCFYYLKSRMNLKVRCEYRDNVRTGVFEKGNTYH